MRLLHIDSSISGQQSVSRQLTASIVARLKQATPGLSVDYLDLAATPLPHLSPALQGAKLKALGMATGQADEAAAGLPRELAAADAALDAFLAADIVVLGAPMYNFGIPSQLKAWIDCLAAPGKTFRYSAAGVEGLAGGKKVIVASSRGGFYAAPSPLAALDHQEAYLAGFFGFIGITDISFVRAEGVNIGADERQRALDAAEAEIAALRVA